MVERDGSIDAFGLDRFGKAGSQRPGLREPVMAGHALHMEGWRLVGLLYLAKVIAVDSRYHLKHDPGSFLRLLLVGREVQFVTRIRLFPVTVVAANVKGEGKAAHGGFQLRAGDVLRQELEICELVRELRGC